MRAIPKITVRIDRGDEWVEMCSDWHDSLPPMCGEGNLKEWVDYDNVVLAWAALNDAVLE